MSQLLRAIPIELELADDAQFRSPNAVSLKLANFAAIDPNYGGRGMSSASELDRAIWDEFGSKPDELHQIAGQITDFISAGDVSSFTPSAPDSDDLTEATEGAIVTRQHQVRERNSKIVKEKKAEARAADPLLRCEACQVSFAETYGEHGDGYIECHHTLPVSQLAPGQRTKKADLALVCANCHRMIHRHKPWLSIAELRKLLTLSGAV